MSSRSRTSRISDKFWRTVVGVVDYPIEEADVDNEVHWWLVQATLE